ncbi:MAG: hypothetical protein JWO82_3883 [Akkermansiaceae bacterium]|nr:hypothetical protein [Akkermansiaceae bacterium]
MPDATQKLRPLEIYTVLGKDVLLIERFRGVEALGRPFEFIVQTVSIDEKLDPDKLIGSSATIRMDYVLQPKERFFNGIISQVAHTGFDRRGYSRWELTMVPRLWFLTRTSDCRIFQNKSVMEIIEDIFGEHLIKDHERRLSRTYAPREYCVQYRETDFDFVHRLMEHEGIYYFFEHQNGIHKLVFCDDMGKHKEVPGFEKIRLRTTEDTVHDEFVIRSWQVRHRATSGSYVLNSYNFESPAPSPVDKLISRDKKDHKHLIGTEEVYDNPGDYTERTAGEAIAKIRREQVQADQATIAAQTTSRGLQTGCKFKLTEHPKEDQNADYIIISSSFQIQGGGYASGAGGMEEQWEAAFTAIPLKDCVFRPARVTAIPRMQGPQTAMICGPKGEEIYTDKYGRVKVQFLWDRYGKYDAGSSCWIRVSQLWAGKNWGAIYTPRIGQEVIVDFLEGDPDRPIITGRVYNGDHPVPYTLPAEATKSTIKSSSSKGGTGFNELRFEDKKGSEQVFIHAEKDEDIRVKNDVREWVGHNRHLVVVNDQLEHVKGNRDDKVDADHKEKIGKDRHLLVSGKEAKEVTGSLSLKVGGAVIQVVGGKVGIQASGDYIIKAPNIILEASSNITLKVGGSHVVIASDGVTVKGPAINVEATGNLILGGGMVKIN